MIKVKTRFEATSLNSVAIQNEYRSHPAKMETSKDMIDSPAMDDTVTAEQESRERGDEENVETRGNIL